MGPEISPAPLGSPTQGESPPSPAQSPQSTNPGSGLNLPWLDPMSPNSATSPIFDDKRASLMGLLSSNRTENTTTGLGLYDSSQERPPGSLKMFLKPFQKFMRSRWSMVLSLLLGIGGAVSHHCLHADLEGEVADDQDWWLRFGQLISFLSKSSFVFAMLMAQQQTAWRAVGKKDYTVRGVNSLFDSSHDIIELLSIEACRKSFLAMMLSLCIRFSPLIIIISSPTLSVSPSVAEDRDAMCQSVRTLNFSQESHNEWDNPKRFESDNLIGISPSNWEITGERGDNDTVEYWALPSTQFQGLANRVFTANQAIQRGNVAEEVCGSDCDCSAVIHFIGPGHKCESVTPKSGILIDDFAGVEAPFSITELAPEGPGGPQYPCHRYRLVNKFVYQQEDLLAVYATAAAIALIGVISGMKAMDKDRVREQREMTFSSIAEATKKLQLDQHTDMKKKIKCFHVGDSAARRLFEFEPQAGREQDNSSKSALDDKPGLMVRETAV